MDNGWKQIEIDGHVVIPFQWRDNDYGRAEFSVCIKWKRGRVAEYWVYPLQQKDRMECWHMVGYDTLFGVNSYDGLQSPFPWLFSWCKEHKTQCMSIYVPPEAKYLILDYHGMSFTRTNWYAKAGE